MQKHKVYMVNGSNSYASWFPFGFEFTKKPADATVAVWEGGCDLDPALYGEKPGSHTYFSKEGSQRELDAWNYFKNKKVFKITTCKGLQNLCVFNGGKMVQHMDHPYRHEVYTHDGKVIDNVISLHHQNPILEEKYTGLKEGIDYELIAHTGKMSSFHLNQNDEDYNFPEDYREPEIVYFPKTLAWGHQAHCEAMSINSDFVQYCRNSVVEKMKQANLL